MLNYFMYSLNQLFSRELLEYLRKTYERKIKLASLGPDRRESPRANIFELRELGGQN